jgi:hypothetical protein
MEKEKKKTKEKMKPLMLRILGRYTSKQGSNRFGRKDKAFFELSLKLLLLMLLLLLLKMILRMMMLTLTLLLVDMNGYDDDGDDDAGVRPSSVSKHFSHTETQKGTEFPK